tara:strand:+ start:8521 stop:8898 length:378 start_codon:yes stop_codon:yes gene_type:complete
MEFKQWWDTMQIPDKRLKNMAEVAWGASRRLLDKPDAERSNDMSRTHHHLKTEAEFYQAIERGEKKFELRKNDRNFKRYDMVYLKESVGGVLTGRSLPPIEIQYVIDSTVAGKWGLCEGYCIFNW